MRRLSEKRKRILAGWLVLGAVITWIPSVVSARQADKMPPRIDRPAITAWEETPNATARTGAGSAAAVARANRGDRDLVASLDRALARVRSVLAGPEPIDLEELARTWGGVVDRRAPEPTTLPANPMPAEKQD